MEPSLNKKRIRNPLNKRLKREIRSDIGKYIVIFALLFVSIGFTSGWIVAGDSMIATYNESFERYNIEDGHFIIQNRANPAQLKAVEDGIKTYEMFYAEFLVEGKDEADSTLRLFKDRTDVNKVCLMEGEMPTKTGEIAVDRMYADNNGLSVGSKIRRLDIEDKMESKEWTITGLVALPDYSALFNDNDDLMFDSILFGVGIVSDEEFSEYQHLNYCYSWKYADSTIAYNGVAASVDSGREKEAADDLMERLNDEVALTDYIPRYLNQAIQFTGDDMGGDKAAMEAFLYIMVVITAFVYAITMRDTITKEATVIGTLLASGYSKGELIRHYMTLPILVTLFSAVIGNIAGYTVFEDIAASMYYGSYSLTTYETRLNTAAFLKTTLIPIAIMAFISWFVLRRALNYSPMNFLRRNLTKQKNKSAVKLNKRLPFFSRFRIRIGLQNIPNYVTLALGIFFANVLLFFGIALPMILNSYQDSIKDNMLAKNQYILSIPREALNEDKKTESMIELVKYMREIETENEDAEKFGVYSLNTVVKEGNKSDEVTIYGSEKNSKYIKADLGPDDVYISSLYADKYGVEPGEGIKLKEKFENKEYDFTVTGILDYEGAISIFMDMDKLNETFDYPKGMFAGYFSDTPIEDISEDYIGSVIDYDSLTKVSRQLLRSFGAMMYLVDAFSVILFVFLIYLLSKIIIEKNAQSISMTKILGYSDGEVGRLYLIVTTIMVIIFVLISFPTCYWVIDVLWRKMIAVRMTGWIRFKVDNSAYIKMFLLGMGSYIVVALLEFVKIRRIPMDEALKNVE